LRDALVPGYLSTGRPQNGRVGRPEGRFPNLLEGPPAPARSRRRWANAVGDAEEASKGGGLWGLVARLSRTPRPRAFITNIRSSPRPPMGPLACRYRLLLQEPPSETIGSLKNRAF